MLTRNFFVALADGGGMLMSDLYKNIITTGGSSGSTTLNLRGLFHHMSTLYKGANYGVFFGTGTTPPTLDDYKPEAAITSGLTAGFSSPVRGVADGCEEYSVGVSLTSDNAVTITEVGLIASNYSTSNYSYSTPYFLVERTVLDEPLVFAAGETKVINYTIRFNYPTA